MHHKLLSKLLQCSFDFNVISKWELVLDYPSAVHCSADTFFLKMNMLQYSSPKNYHPNASCKLVSNGTIGNIILLSFLSAIIHHYLVINICTATVKMNEL